MPIPTVWSVKVRLPLFIALCACFFFFGSTHGYGQLPKAGLVLCKPNVWSPDSKAKLYEYASYEDHTGYWNLTYVDGRKEQLYIGTIVASIAYPKESDYPRLAVDADRDDFLKEIARLKESETKYPATKNYLEPFINNLQSQIDQYAKGGRKIKGVWFTQKQLEKMDGENQAADGAIGKATQTHADLSSTQTIIAYDGTVFHNATVIREEPDGLTIAHLNGVTKVDFENLPVSLRAKYHYDTIAAAAYRKSKPQEKNGGN